MKKIRGSKKYWVIVNFLLIVIFGACRKDEIIPIPKVSAGPDMEFQAPLGLIELDASETFNKNPKARMLRLIHLLTIQTHLQKLM
jgi:hypothetical protein